MHTDSELHFQEGFKEQYTEIWYHKIFPIAFFTRLVLIFQVQEKMLMVPLMIFDLAFVFSRSIKFETNPYEMIVKTCMIYLSQHIAGKTHIFYIFGPYLLLNVAGKRYAYSIYLITNIAISSIVMGHNSIYETAVMISLLCLTMSLTDSLNAMTSTLLEDRLNLEREISKEKFKAQFVTIASHELRNPLQALTFLISYLDTFESSKKQKNIIGDVKSTVSLLISIIDSILDTSKVSSSKLQAKFVKMNLVEIVERVGCIFYPKAVAKQIGVYIDVDSNIPSELIGDPTLISQVLSNFTSNALKFCDEGRIVLSIKLLENNNGKCLLKASCNDTGIGITADNQKLLFQPFGQISSPTQEENKGWGLGLAITKDIADLLDGKIELESCPGKGSTFSFIFSLQSASKDTVRDMLLPLYIDAIVVIVREDDAYLILEKYLKEMGLKSVENGMTADLKAIRPEDYLMIDQRMIPQNLDLLEKFQNIIFIGEAIDPKTRVLNEPICYLKLNRFFSQENRMMNQPSNDPIEQNENLSVLLVEDNILIHRFESKLFQKHGIKNVTSAYNGQEALNLVQKSPSFDVILMDIQMPVMDGIQATKKIRLIPDPVRSKIPIIMVTGNSLFDAQQCYAIGANAVIAKPVNFDEVLGTIKRVTGNKLHPIR